MTLDLIPNFPRNEGEEHAVEFTKDGRKYRIVRIDSTKLVIHRAGSSREEFEILLDGNGSMFDVDVRNDGQHVAAYGANKTMIWNRLF